MGIFVTATGGGRGGGGRGVAHSHHERDTPRNSNLLVISGYSYVLQSLSQFDL